MMLVRFASASLLAGLFFGASAQAAKKKPGLGPYAGSYTGTATSVTSVGALTGSATLTFTGKEFGLRGTFLYRGILNQGGVAQIADQVFDLSNRGVVSGRVNVGELPGTGAGKVNFSKKKLTFAVVYRLTGMTATTTYLTGKVAFRGRKATLTATVVSSDPGFNGTLRVTGTR